MSWTLKWMTLACVTLVMASGSAGAAAGGGAQLPAVDSRDFAGAAKAAPVGSRLRLENVAVSDAEPAALVLERFEVFAQGATVTLHEAGGDRVLPAPANAYFRGAIDGKPESHAFLAVLADGSTQGILEDADATYLIGAEGAPAKSLGGPLTMQRVDPVLLKSARNSGFRCANDQLQPTNVHALPKGLDFTPVTPAAPAAGTASAADALPGVTATATYGAKVAIETDVEFYQLFNNSTTATNYIGNLIGYASTIYAAEINTGLAVQSVSLWTGGTDPWTQTGTQCGLLEFGKYWNVNKTGVSRTIAHFMSGKANGGGIAWVGVLCSGSFNTGGAAACPALGTESTPWGGGYGYTGNLSGTFNINSPTVVWDIDAVAHEIGHNFNSPHSHCYAGIGGNASPIDQCYSGEQGCYSGTTSLPGPSGIGSGTIMSYCHLLAPGMSNIKLTFGNTETFGVAPTRESARMSSYVASVAAGGQSACLAPAAGGGGIFSDGFEGGAVPGPWSSKTP
jgi:hypothetical protein